MLTWSGLGMNMSGFGVIDANWPKTVSKYYAQVGELKRREFTKIRFGNYPVNFTNPPALAKNVIKYIIDQGLFVMSGPTYSATLTDANYQAYEDIVLADAAIAQSQGWGAFSIGNELEAINDNTTLTDSQLFDKLKETAAKVRLVYSGDITYNSTGGETIVNLWASKGISEFSYMCFNIYGANQSDLTGFTADAQRIWDHFNTLAKISEFGLVTQSGTLTLTQDQQQQALKDRIDALISIGFEDAYVFTMMKTSPNQINAMKFLEGNYRQQMLAVVSGGITIANEKSSADFSTTNGRIDCGNHAELHSNEFTYTSVFRPKNTSTHRTLFGWSENGTPQFRVNNLNQLQLLKQNIASIAVSSITLDPNRFYFAAVTYNTLGEYKLYLSPEDEDPILVASGTSLQTWSWGSAKLYLGNIVGFAQAFRGLMSTQKMFNRELSLSELKISKKENTYNSLSGCVGCWNHNEETGTVSIDQYGNNGAMTGVTYSGHVINPIVL